MYRTDLGNVRPALAWALAVLAASAATSAQEGRPDRPNAPSPFVTAAAVLSEAPAPRPGAIVADPRAARVEAWLAQEDYSELAQALVALGVEVALFQPGGQVKAADGTVALSGYAPDRARALAKFLGEAERAGLQVMLGPVDVSLSGATALAKALASAERAVPAQGSLAGLCLRLPALPAPQPAATPEDSDAALASWQTQVRSLVGEAARASGPLGRRVYVLSDSPELLGLALRDAPEGVSPMFHAELGREPTLGYGYRVAAVSGSLEPPGVWLDSPTASAHAMVRAMALACLRGARLLCLGDARYLLGEALDGRYVADMAASLKEFASLPDRKARTGVALVVDAEAQARGLLGPASGLPSETPSNLAAAMALNSSGYPWSLVTDPTVLEALDPDAVVVPAGAAMPEQAIAALEAYTRGGGRLVCFAEFGARQLSGEDRLKADRLGVDLMLPAARVRRVRHPLTTLRMAAAIPGARHAKGDEIPVRPGEGQSVFLPEAHSGSETLAVYPALGAPAVLAWALDAGRVAWVNGSPEMLGGNLLADVLAHLGVSPVVPDRGGDLRAPTNLDGMHAEQRGRVLDYRTVALNPEWTPLPAAPDDGSMYDMYLAGPNLTAVSLGYRHENLADGSVIGIGMSDIGLHSFRTAVVADGGRTVWTDAVGIVEWPPDSTVEHFEPATGQYVTCMFAPGNQCVRATEPGLYRLAVKPPGWYPAVIDDGGAGIARCVQAADGSCSLRVREPGTVVIRLSPDILETKSVEVRRTEDVSGAGPMPVPEGPAWHVDHTGVLQLAATPGGEYTLVFPERGPEPLEYAIEMDRLSGASVGTVDGTRAVWMERYQETSCEAVITRWGSPGQGADLILHAVTGDLYGAQGADLVNPPARLRVFVNGQAVKELDSTAPACVPDGEPSEWGEIRVPIPAHCLRRGTNTVRLVNRGPNWFAFDSLVVRMRPAQ